MHLKATFNIPKLNLAKAKQALHEKLSEALAQGCKTWLTTVIKESTEVGLPIWSGASIATLSPLASEVGFALMTGPLAPGAPDRVAMGMANGTAEFEAGTRQPGLYTFTYYTTLDHLVVNEYFDANTFVNPKTGHPYFNLHHPGPYHFQEKAERAFREFASYVVLPGWGLLLDIATVVVD